MQLHAGFTALDAMSGVTAFKLSVANKPEGEATASILEHCGEPQSLTRPLRVVAGNAPTRLAFFLDGEALPHRVCTPLLFAWLAP